MSSRNVTKSLGALASACAALGAIVFAAACAAPLRIEASADRPGQGGAAPPRAHADTGHRYRRRRQRRRR